MSIREAEPQAYVESLPSGATGGTMSGGFESEAAAPKRRAPRSRPDLLLSALTATLLGAGIFSLLGPIVVGMWMMMTIVMIALVFSAGYLLRRLRVPLAVVPLIQALLVIGALTLFFVPSTAALGVVPTASAIEGMERLLSRAVNDIVFGIAPMVATDALTFLLVAATGALAVVLDTLIVSARLPVLGGAIALVVGLIAPLIVPGPVNLNALILMLVLMFLVVRRVTALGERRLSATAERGGPAASAAIIVVSALVVGGAIAPLVEGPRSQIIPGFGPALSISPLSISAMTCASREKPTCSPSPVTELLRRTCASPPSAFSTAKRGSPAPTARSAHSQRWRHRPRSRWGPICA